MDVKDGSTQITPPPPYYRINSRPTSKHALSREKSFTPVPDYEVRYQGHRRGEGEITPPPPYYRSPHPPASTQITPPPPYYRINSRPTSKHALSREKSFTPVPDYEVCLSRGDGDIGQRM